MRHGQRAFEPDVKLDRAWWSSRAFAESSSDTGFGNARAKLDPDELNRGDRRGRPGVLRDHGLPGSGRIPARHLKLANDGEGGG